MTATFPQADDPAVHLLALQIAAKKAEQAARRSLGDALMGPGFLVPYFVRVHAAAKAAEKTVHKEIRRTCSRVVIPFIPRSAAR